MASDGDRLKAERFYIESPDAPPDVATAAHCGIDRGTVKRYREAGDWEIKRAEYWRRATGAATIAAVAGQAAASILSRLDGLALLASFANDKDGNVKDRIAAIKLAADIERWVGADAIEGDGKPTRLVIGRPNG